LKPTLPENSGFSYFFVILSALMGFGIAKPAIFRTIARAIAQLATEGSTIPYPRSAEVALTEDAPRVIA
jgi:hypothetical protein